jgi:FkbM family methyltransferase
MKSIIRKSAAGFINFLMSSKITIPVANSLYENGSFKFRDFFVMNVKQPNFDFNWYFTLLNGKKIQCLVQNNLPNTWHFAISYIWHDTGLSIVEKHLNSFYKNNFAYFDIGSNVGLRSVFALSENRPTVLFDPNPEVSKISKQMIDLNHFKNYKIEQSGLSDTVGELSFYISSSAYMSSFDKEHAAKDKIVAEIKIPVTTINLYLKANPQFQPKIVKIDVEGFEINVLRGASEMLENYKPALLIEILDTTDNRKSILDYLASYNYEAFYLFNRNEGMLVSAAADNQKQNHNYLFIADEALKAHLKSLNCFATV